MTVEYRLSCRRSDVEPGAVVHNPYGETVGVHERGDRQVLGAGMLDDVDDRFTNDAIARQFACALDRHFVGRRVDQDTKPGAPAFGLCQRRQRGNQLTLLERGGAKRP